MLVSFPAHAVADARMDPIDGVGAFQNPYIASRSVLVASPQIAGRNPSTFVFALPYNSERQQALVRQLASGAAMASQLGQFELATASCKAANSGEQEQLLDGLARSMTRLERLCLTAKVLMAVVLLRVFCLILLEYPNYFPANFESMFLAGRDGYFYGHYSIAFYAHIVTGPISLLLAALLMSSGRGWISSRWLMARHAMMGKSLAAIVVLAMLPSGVVMATRAFTGPIAGLGFASQALLTGVTVVLAANYARRRNYERHQRWATRCFLLLLAPLLLRLGTGFFYVTGIESAATYQLLAWISWIVPLVCYESVWRIRARRVEISDVQSVMCNQ